jgi:hypothetical protein
MRSAFLGILLSAFTLVLSSKAVVALTPTERVAQVLVNQGFEIESVKRTWTGRIKLTVTRADFERVITINATSGKVLGDHWVELSDEASDASKRDRDADAQVEDASAKSSAAPAENAKSGKSKKDNSKAKKDKAKKNDKAKREKKAKRDKKSKDE